MILWTTQHVKVWDILREQDVFYADGRRVWKVLRPSYHWLMERTGLKRFPIWAEYSREGIRKKPDLRRTGLMPPGCPSVLMELDVPDELVTLSRLDLWAFVIGGHYLACSEEDDNKHCDATQAQKEKSWENIFDLKWGDPDWYGDPNEETIQATFSVIKLRWMRKLQFFKGR